MSHAKVNATVNFKPNYVTAVAINAGMYALADKYGMEALGREDLGTFQGRNTKPNERLFPLKSSHVSCSSSPLHQTTNVIFAIW